MQGAWLCCVESRGCSEKNGFSEKGQKLMLEFQLRRISAMHVLKRMEKVKG
jgi:hypothetical protein